MAVELLGTFMFLVDCDVFEVANPFALLSADLVEVLVSPVLAALVVELYLIWECRVVVADS